MIYWLTFAAALGSGIIGGVFYGFSTFIMKALGELPPAGGIAAMQSINVVVINPLFLGVFMGTAGLCVVTAILAIMNWTSPGSCWLLAGSVLYFFGCFAATMLFNVPLNNALAAVNAGSAEGAKLWTRYLTDWTMWNHVRTAASLAAAACFIFALR